MPFLDLNLPSFFTTALLVVHWTIIIGLGLRIILKRRPTGVSLAWFLLITTVPVAGAVIYLFVGELWLPHRRITRYNLCAASLRSTVERLEQEWELSNDRLPELARPLNSHVHVPLGISAVGGNSFELFSDTGRCLRAIAEDIDRARVSVNLLTYIWQSEGDPELVASALMRAAERGVPCRVLVDSAGSRDFLSGAMAKRMRKAGVEIVEAMPVGMFRFLFSRIDIRNHRKIIVIDHNIGYTGSMNIVDPRYFHTKKNVGQWVDVMARLEGPAARVLDMTMALDWGVECEQQRLAESDILINDLRRAEPARAGGEYALQVVPSGPDQAPEMIHDMLLTLIYGCHRTLTITTPYFIPSEAMLTALTAAAKRGVATTLVVPNRIDSVLVRYASKSYYDDLFDAGVEVRAYKGGLLHSKTVTADDSVALLGTVNMDKRSFSINFEISLFAYSGEIVSELREVQASYIADSLWIDPAAWRKRSLASRVAQNAVQLLSPIL